MYIVIDGMDGCGKGTLIKSLEKEFPNFFFVREPGGTEVGERIRKIILEDPLDFMTELHLFFAQRHHLLNTVVVPYTSRGEVVISDRGLSSTFAFQLCGRMHLQELEKYFWDTVSHLPKKADVYIFLDLPAEVASERTRARSADFCQQMSHFDAEQLEFHQRVRNGFLQFGQREAGSKVFVVNAENSPGQVLQEVRDILRVLFSEKKLSLTCSRFKG